LRRKVGLVELVHSKFLVRHSTSLSVWQMALAIHAASKSLKMG
jgi:hypothetical protein